MPIWAVVLGQVLDGLATLWIGLILVDSLFMWFFRGHYPKGVLLFALAWTANQPINSVRRIVPTAVRGLDFAPWLTILLLVLLKTFALRGMIYWGLLSRAGH